MKVNYPQLSYREGDIIIPSYNYLCVRYFFKNKKKKKKKKRKKVRKEPGRRQVLRIVNNQELQNVMKYK